MKKLLLIATLLFSLGTNAQKVSIDDARSKAVEFLSHSGRMKKVAAKGLKNSDLTLAKNNSDKIYVFNIGNDEGYVVVSGDSRTRSILGYGNGHGFDMESAPDNMKAWLRSYELATANLRTITFQHRWLKYLRMNFTESLLSLCSRANGTSMDHTTTSVLRWQVSIV